MLKQQLYILFLQIIWVLIQVVKRFAPLNVLKPGNVPLWDRKSEVVLGCFPQVLKSCQIDVRFIHKPFYFLVNQLHAVVFALLDFLKLSIDS